MILNQDFHRNGKGGAYEAGACSMGADESIYESWAKILRNQINQINHHIPLHSLTNHEIVNCPHFGAALRASSHRRTT
jgi:hypothetical protein